MYTTQLLMQMAAASTAVWKTQTASSGKNSVQDQGTSFQTLLEQRQERSAQGSGDSGEGSTASQIPAEDTKPEENQTQDSQIVSVDLAALGAALLADGIYSVQPETTGEVVQPQEMVPSVSPDLMPCVGSETETAEAAPALSVQEQPMMSPVTEQPASKTVQDAPLTEISTQMQTPEKLTQTEPSTDAQGDTYTAAQDQQSGGTTRREDFPQVTDSTGNWQAPLFEQTEQMPVKVGETVTVDTTAPASQLEQDLGKVLDRGLEDGEQRLEIRLSPANLGTVTAEFVRSPEGALHVVLRAENPEAAKLLGDHAGALGLLLQDGTRGEVRVEVPQPQQDQQLWQQPDQEGGRQQQQQQQQRQTPQQETETFLHQLRLGLVETGLEEIM